MAEPYRISCAEMFAGHDSLRNLSPQFIAEKLETAIESAVEQTLLHYADARLLLYSERKDAGAITTILDGLYGTQRPRWDVRQGVTVTLKLLFKNKAHKEALDNVKRTGRAALNGSIISILG